MLLSLRPRIVCGCPKVNKLTHATSSAIRKWIYYLRKGKCVVVLQAHIHTQSTGTIGNSDVLLSTRSVARLARTLVVRPGLKWRPTTKTWQCSAVMSDWVWAILVKLIMCGWMFLNVKRANCRRWKAKSSKSMINRVTIMLKIIIMIITIYVNINRNSLRYYWYITHYIDDNCRRRIQTQYSLGVTVLVDCRILYYTTTDSNIIRWSGREGYRFVNGNRTCCRGYKI